MRSLRKLIFLLFVALPLKNSITHAEFLQIRQNGVVRYSINNAIGTLEYKFFITNKLSKTDIYLYHIDSIPMETCENILNAKVTTNSCDIGTNPSPLKPGETCEVVLNSNLAAVDKRASSCSLLNKLQIFTSLGITKTSDGFGVIR